MKCVGWSVDVRYDVRIRCSMFVDVRHDSIKFKWRHAGNLKARIDDIHINFCTLKKYFHLFIFNN